MAGVKMMGMALLALERAVPLLGASSDEGRDALQALTRLSKHVPPGTVTPTDVKNVLQQLMTQQQQFGQQMSAMRQQQAAPAQTAPGAGAPPQPQPVVPKAA